MGKITVEIKKSTFGKPLHNFDHPKALLRGKNDQHPVKPEFVDHFFTLSNTCNYG